MRAWLKSFKPKAMRWLLRHMSLYPPFIGAGIRVKADPDGGRYWVRMGLRPYDRNYYGTHFGGNLYSMCDPFFVLILAQKLGPAYAVWDKSARIDFLMPGRGTVEAEFAISNEEIAEIRRQVDTEGKLEPELSAEIRGPGGTVVARVHKLLSVRRNRDDREARTDEEQETKEPAK